MSGRVIPFVLKPEVKSRLLPLMLLLASVGKGAVRGGTAFASVWWIQSGACDKAWARAFSRRNAVLRNLVRILFLA